MTPRHPSVWRSAMFNVRDAMGMAGRASLRWRGIRRFEASNSHSSMVKASRDINILAVLPLASNAGCTVSAATVAAASMANAASKYFRISILARLRVS